jgi:hypothetical protein
MATYLFFDYRWTFQANVCVTAVRVYTHGPGEPADGYYQGLGFK